MGSTWGLRFESLLRPCVVLSSAERKIITYQQTKWLPTRKSVNNTASIPGMLKKIKFAFEVYDFKGDGKVDGFYIGDLVRACNLNPTMKTIVEIGGEKEKGKKTIVLEDMYPLSKKAKDSKDTGGIHDFVEILKLYDKNSDKTMLSKDLFRLLTNLGEKLTKEEAKGLMNELCDPEDAEGSTPFMPFLERMCKNDVA